MLRSCSVIAVSVPRQLLYQVCLGWSVMCHLFWVLLQHLSNFSLQWASRTLPHRSINRSGKGRCCAVVLYYVVSLWLHGVQWLSKEAMRKFIRLLLVFISPETEREPNLTVHFCLHFAKLQMLSVPRNLCMTLLYGLPRFFCPHSPNWVYFWITDADRVIIIDSNRAGLQLGLWLQAARNGNGGYYWPVSLCTASA